MSNKIQNSKSENLYSDLRNNPNHFWIGTFSSKDISRIHVHDFMQLWYVLKGSYLHYFNGVRFTQHAGELLIVPPFFKHSIDTSKSDGIKFICCEFSEGFVNNVFSYDKKGTLFYQTYLQPLLENASLMNPVLSFDIDTTNKLEIIFNHLLREYQKITEFSFTYIRMNLIKFLTIIASKYENADNTLFSKYRTSILRTFDYTEENYSKNITLKDICTVAMMSVSSFSHVFKQITGTTFIEYLNYLRVNQARERLVHTNQTVVDICLDCGFRDVTYFNHVFKKLTGFAPITYRDIYEEINNVY